MTNAFQAFKLPRRHLLDPWRDAFVLELRLRDVGGARIGDALAEVDAHCADAAQTPQEAFGEPAAYARSVAQSLPDAARASRTPWWKAALLGLGVVGGVLALLAGVASVAHGTPATISAGALTSTAAITVFVAGFAGALHVLARRRAVMAVALGLGWVMATLPEILWTRTAFTGPGWLLLATGVLALGTIGLLGYGPARLAADEVTDPRTGRPAFRLPRGALLLIRWLLPALLLFALILVIFLPAPR